MHNRSKTLIYPDIERQIQHGSLSTGPPVSAIRIADSRLTVATHVSRAAPLETCVGDNALANGPQEIVRPKLVFEDSC
jgi:hypothetical protein